MIDSKLFNSPVSKQPINSTATSTESASVWTKEKVMLLTYPTSGMLNIPLVGLVDVIEPRPGTVVPFDRTIPFTFISVG